MLGDVLARKYSKTGTCACSILEKFAFDTTLRGTSRVLSFKYIESTSNLASYCCGRYNSRFREKKPS